MSQRLADRRIVVLFGLPTDTKLLSEIASPELVKAEGVRKLTVLAWLCALDRPHYHETYNTNAGRSDVKMLLRDTMFLLHTMNVPKLESYEAEEDLVRMFPKHIYAAELCGAICCLAVSNLDDHECASTTCFP